MKAARLYDKHDIRVEEVPAPAIGEEDVLVRVKSAFICGTDVRMFKNGKAGIDPLHPRILGHELSGVIEETGRRVEGYRQGMRVAAAPNYGCGVCDRCTGGDNQLCRDSRAIGVDVDGGFAEFVRVPGAAVRQGNIAPIADALSFEAAALAEPLSCVYNAYQKAGIFPGDRVLVIGAGPVGLMHAKLARLAGAAAIFINDISPERLAQCVKIDPQLVVLPAEHLKEALMEKTDGNGADLVITAASAAVIQEAAFDYAAMNGRVIFFGGLTAGVSRVSLDTNQIHYKQLLVTGTTRQSLRQYRKTLDLLGSGTLIVDDLVTSTAPLEKISEIIENVSLGKGLKASIRF